MELADAALLAALRIPERAPYRRRQIAGVAALPDRPRPQYRQTGTHTDDCACGRCQRKRQDQKWEEIWQAKFADPDYYGLHARQTSMWEDL